MNDRDFKKLAEETGVYLVANNMPGLNPPHSWAYGPSEWSAYGSRQHMEMAVDALNMVEGRDKYEPKPCPECGGMIDAFGRHHIADCYKRGVPIQDIVAEAAEKITEDEATVVEPA